MKGGIDDVAGTVLRVSLGLGCDAASETPASEGLESRVAGGWVAEVGVGRGGGWAVCAEAFRVTVGRRFLFGCPFEYCGCFEGPDGC